MKIYANTTIQYLDADIAGGEAGWYAVTGGLAPTAEGAVQSLNDLGEAIADMPVILNAASQSVARPAYLNTISATFIVESDFSPTGTYEFAEAQASSIYNAVQFADGLSLTEASVTEYTKASSVDHTTLTLTFATPAGATFDMHFEYADSAFSFGLGADAPRGLDAFIARLDDSVETEQFHRGSEGFDSIKGDEEDNHIDGITGRDTINGYGGNDTIQLQAGEAYGGEGNDTITVNSEGTTLSASLYGGAGDDTLTGGANRDGLTGGAGADTLDGGASADTAYYVDSSEAVEIDLAAGKGKGGDAEGDTLISIEGAVGSSKDDKFTGNDAHNRFYGRDGDDEFIASEGYDYYNGGKGANDHVDYSDYGSAIKGDLFDTKATTFTKADGSEDVIVGVEHLTATEFADEVSGSDASNKLDGLGGDDILRGKGGDDTLSGGAGNDTLMGGAGADKIIGGEGTDTASYGDSERGVVLDLSDSSKNIGDAAGDTFESIEKYEGSKHTDVMRGTEGNDVIHGNGGTDSLHGKGGNDTLTIQGGFAYGDEGNDTITVENGIAGHVVRLYGGAGDDTLTGGVENTFIVGGSGADMIDGGEGRDTVSYASSDAGVYVNLTNGKARGGEAAGDTVVNVENVVGSNFNDELRGSGEVNSLSGGKGDDILSGAVGGDDLSGGAGSDTVDYHYSNEGVKVDLSLQAKGASGRGKQDGAGGHAEGDILSGIENIKGSKFDDELRGSDEVSWRGKQLTAGENTLVGGKGNDVLEGLGGADKLIGGSGRDTASYESSDAAVSVNLATGEASGGDATGDMFSSIEDLKGSDHNDHLVGDGSANIITGGKGDDTIEGGAGADIIVGGEGSDTASYEGSSSGVIVNLGKGTAVRGDAKGDKLIEIENLEGSAHNDILVGDAQNNVLMGGAGYDRLKGGEGQDTLDGGAGNDVLISENDGNVLIGGEGNDLFDLSRVKDLSDIATDIIKDFKQGSDMIKLSSAHLGEDNVVTAVETTMNGVSGVALTTNVGNSTVNFAFLEGVSDISVDDFAGDHIPMVDMV